MIFPKSTIINKKISKKRFYENSEISSSIKKKFINYIGSVTLSNKFSKDTINISGTDEVEEIFVIQVFLKSEEYLDKIEDVLSIIDRSIPYPVLFEFQLGENHFVYKIAYKKKSKIDDNKSVVDVYFTREIIKKDLKRFEKEIKGVFNSLNLEIFYEKLIRLFIKGDKNLSIDRVVEKHKKYALILREIEILEKKVSKEKQADKQFKLFKELKEKKAELKKYKKL
jgi:hypothetical protein